MIVVEKVIGVVIAEISGIARDFLTRLGATTDAATNGKTKDHMSVLHTRIIAIVS